MFKSFKVKCQWASQLISLSLYSATLSLESLQIHHWRTLKSTYVGIPIPMDADPCGVGLDEAGVFDKLPRSFQCIAHIAKHCSRSLFFKVRFLDQSRLGAC